MSEFTVSREGMTLDLCCWLHYYSAAKGAVYELPAGVVEAALGSQSQDCLAADAFASGHEDHHAAHCPVSRSTKVVRLWD